MILPKIRVLHSHGRQAIPDLDAVELTPEFRGRPCLTETRDADDAEHAAALLLIFPHGDNPDDRNFIDAWSWVLFGGVFVGSWRKVNPILLIVLSAGAGILIYYVF